MMTDVEHVFIHLGPCDYFNMPIPVFCPYFQNQIILLIYCHCLYILNKYTVRYLYYKYLLSDGLFILLMVSLDEDKAIILHKSLTFQSSLENALVSRLKISLAAPGS